MPTQPSANMNASWTPSESMDSWGSSSGSPDQATQQSPSSHATTSKTRPNMLSRDASSRSKSYSSSSNSPRRPKVKTQQNHRMVCHDCGATDTPQWRTGANGPGTLCNVCGLLFAKRTQLHVSQFN